MILIGYKEETIDFDIVGNYAVSESLASFLITKLDLLSKLDDTTTTDDIALLSSVLSLAERNCNIYYMTPIGESFIGDNCIISILFNMHDACTPNTPDKFVIGMSDYYKTVERYVNHINKFSLSNVHITISYSPTYLAMRIDGTLKSIECNNTNILLKKLRRIQENSTYGIPEEAKNLAIMYDETMSKTILPELCSYMESHNTLKNPAKFFKVKDAKVSKDRTIIFWEDGTKTVIKKAEVEKEFDLEKAIMAAFTRRALSFGHTAKERSVDETIDNIAGMVNDHLDYEIAKREKLLQKVIIPKQEDYDDE